MKFALMMVIGLAAGSAQAGCPDTEALCHSMHTMSSQMDCLSGASVQPIQCDTDVVEAAGLKASSKTARVAIEADKEFAPDAATVAAIELTFNKLDAAIDHLVAAVTKGDAPAKAAALAEIVAVKKQGHMDFKN